DCYELYRDVLGHCAKIQSRIAILDIQDGYKNRIQDGGQEDIITRFREAIGSENLSYAAVYYPWLETNITDKKDVCFDCLAMDKNEFEALLRETTAQEFFEAIIKTPVSETEEPSDIHEIADDQENQVRTAEEQIPFVDLNGFEITAEHYHLGLLATSPTYSKLIDELWSTINLLPPSSAMAGIYTAVDNDRGVWKSPANISVANVIKPTVNITHDEQENLNVDAVSGKSINAIRTFPGVGTMVWGGRTLDGNSLDWRYINVRRTMIMLEQSIKLALRAYVFEPNDANTWVTVKSMIVNFLTQKWNQGALAGATPEDAFGVQVGLGTTMTSSDILEGRMLIVVNLAIVRPAEFIVVSFEQEMQKS
ncbi:MAG: phage tail sheath family protein, partial [Flavobacteriaceae bacterium]|nr:phage tail sheath family protein [Flavobacteriaceae bacterium]